MAMIRNDILIIGKVLKTQECFVMIKYIIIKKKNIFFVVTVASDANMRKQWLIYPEGLLQHVPVEVHLVGTQVLMFEDIPLQPESFELVILDFI